MTREEAIKILKGLSWFEKTKIVYSETAEAIDYILHSVSWHKTSEELPRKGGSYLCMDENKHIVQLSFCGTKWVNTSQFLDMDLCLVKYWMEIPEMPKED